MSYDERYATTALRNSYISGKYGIEAKSIGSAKTIATRGDNNWTCPWKDCYHGVRGGTNLTRPVQWRDSDTFLKTAMGYNVTFDEKNTIFGENVVEKSLSRYSSQPVQRNLKSTGLEYSEEDLLKEVDHIKECLDLRPKEAISIPNLKSVGINVTLDASSGLQDLSGLKTIGGKLSVIAKNKQEMNTFLQKIGIMAKDGSIATTINDGIHLIMKNYL